MFYDLGTKRCERYQHSPKELGYGLKLLKGDMLLQHFEREMHPLWICNAGGCGLFLQCLQSLYDYSPIEWVSSRIQFYEAVVDNERLKGTNRGIRKDLSLFFFFFFLFVLFCFRLCLSKLITRTEI